MGGILKSLIVDSLKASAAWIKDRIANADTDQVAKKIFRVFEAHGIKKTHILDMLPKELGVTLDDIKNPTTFKKKITGDLLVFLSDTLNLNPKWFHDDKEHIYNEISAYKGMIRNYVDLLVRIRRQKKLVNLIVFKPVGDLSASSDLKMILSEGCIINGVEFERHIVIRELWRWEEYGGDQIRLMTRMFFTLNLGYVFGYSASYDNLHDLDDGRIFVSEVKRIPKDLWQPDFYAICPSEGSLAALDTETMTKILEWGKKQNLIQYFEKKARKRITSNPLKKFCQAQELSGAND